MSQTPEFPSVEELQARLSRATAMAERLQLQYEIAGVLAESESVSDALRDVLKTLGLTKGWCLAQAWVIDDDHVNFYAWQDAVSGLDAYIQASRALDPSKADDALGQALRAGTIAWLNDSSQQTTNVRHQAALAAGLKNQLVFPLRRGSRTYGAIELVSRRCDAPEEGFESLFHLLGRDIARFLETMQYEQELEKRNTRLAQAQRIARTGHWEWRPRTGQLKTNKGTLRALGYGDAAAPATLDDYLAHVPDADRQQLHSVLLDVQQLRRRDVEFEHAFESPDGVLRLVVLRVEAKFDAQGCFSRIVGMVQDVTERRHTELQMRAAERRWASVFKNSPVPGLVTDAATGECLAANDEFLEWFGAGQNDVLGYTTDALGLWTPAQPREQIVVDLQKKGYLRHYEAQVNSCKGLRQVLLSVERLDIDERHCYLVKFVDISERKALENQLRLIATAVDQAAEAMVILDANGHIISVNPAFSRITGYASTEAVGQQMDALLNRPTGLHDDLFFRRIVGYLLSAGHWEGEVWALRKNGDVFPELLSLSVIRDSAGKVVNYVGVFNDITDRKEQEDKLKKLALYDGLTGLPNRTLLKEYLEQAIARAKRQNKKIALIFCDLDRFKPVNDTYGHDVGDELLKRVARRFRSCVRASDLVGRLGGDEFIVVLENISGPDDAASVAHKIIDAMSAPFVVDHHLLEIGTSAGIALYPEHGDKPRLLMRRADAALYLAKETGRAAYRFWEG